MRSARRLQSSWTGGPIFGFLVLAIQSDGKFNGDLGSFSGRTVDGRVATEKPRPFTDSIKAKTLFGHSRRIESHSLIGDLDAQVIVALHQTHYGMVGLAMSSDVVQTLLDDSKHGILQPRIQPVELHVVMKHHLLTVLGYLVGNQVSDGVDDPFLFDDGGTLLVDYATSFGGRALE